MPTTRKQRRSSFTLFGVILATVLLVAPAFAQDPVVNSADPSETLQETYDLEVTVSGDNFGSDSVVDFFVTGTQDPGGISVTNVKRQGPKTLKVKIDVAPDAQTQYKFDIQVQSRGRTGKGIELFRVNEKTHPDSDTTPPAPPGDLHVVETTFNSATLVWTVPADDGTEPASGRVATCQCSTDGETYGYGTCGILVGNPSPGWGDPEDYLPWPDPGEEQTAIQVYLEPETHYDVWVICGDEAMNRSDPAWVDFTTDPFSGDPSWTIEEVMVGGAPVQFDAVAGHGYTADGDLLVAGTVVLWDQNVGSRKVPIHPKLTRFITGSRDGASWVWSYGAYEDLPDFAGLLHIDPQGRPVLEGAILRDARTQTHDLVYAYHDGSGWQTEVVATETGPSKYYPAFRWERGFAFDPGGNPAIAWCADDGNGGARLARREMPDQWTVEVISQEACETGSAGLAFDGQGRPAVSYVLEREWPAPYESKVSIWSEAPGWVEEEFCRGPEFPYGVSCSGTPWLAFDPVEGAFSAVATTGDGYDSFSWLEVCDREGPGSWSCAPRFLGAHPEGGILDFRWSTFLEFDSQGELLVPHIAAHGPGFSVTRRLSGQSELTEENVDHPITKSLPSDSLQGGPFLALDPLTEQPTLTWTWSSPQDPTDFHLYFAWK